MKHIYALAIKFLMVSAILEIVLRLSTGLAATEILVISATVTALSYGGDLLFLPKVFDSLAAIIDAGLSFVIIYMFNYWSRIEKIGIYDAIICAVIIGIGELFYHKFLELRIFPNKRAKSK